MKRTTAFLSCLALFALGGGCTFAQIAQLSKPKPAQAPAAKSFPEAERLLRTAAYEYEPGGQQVRAYVVADKWASGEHGSRAVGLVLFYQRAGGPLVKGEGGNQDAVCFQYNCAMEQKLAPSGAFAGPTVECEQGITKKVTCSSVASLPAGVPSA